MAYTHKCYPSATGRAQDREVRRPKDRRSPYHSTQPTRRPQPRRLCVRWGPSPPPPQKGAEPPIFGPRLLWSNGCVDQDASWYGGTPRLRDIVLDGDTAPPPLKVHSPKFSANVRCGQTAGWTMMPFGMEVGLGPGGFVFDGDPATSRKKGTLSPPNFWPMSIVAKRLDGSRCHLVRR